jgi:hypothetical protein
MAQITPYLANTVYNSDFAFCPTSLLYSATLAATTDTTVTMPGTAKRYKVLMKSTMFVWVAYNNVASVPAGATFAQTTSELLSPYFPLCRDLKKDDVIHFFSPTASAEVSLVLYTVQI